MMTSPADDEHTAREPAKEETTSDLIARIEKRTREFVQNPACAAIATVTTLDVVIAPDAQPGDREIRLVTARGVSNPLTFHVGQLPESTRKPMPTTPRQVLGKEAQALRKRPASEIEERVTLPCTVNGQIGSGEVNWYRFEARQGQRLVITTLARQLIPFIADAVPGWFQPVLTLYDATGKEVAYADDYRFDPDPTLVYEVPRRSEYRLAIRDSIYRGREDFVYRITIGDVPFVTSIFPLGGQAGKPLDIKMHGWNLEEALLSPPPRDAVPGLYWLTATRRGLCSNRVPFALDALPEALEQPPNDRPETPQTVALPLVINGRIEKPDDWDVFAFTGHANQSIVAEVQARRLGSPLDSVLKLTDPTGTVLALNDDYEDVASGLTTHQADSCFLVTLPADGTYHVHLGDTARQGGEAYGYRLRLSEPKPDFALRVAPSSIGLRGRSTATVSVYAQRKDGFDSPIRLALQNPPRGFSAPSLTLAATQTVARLTIRSDRGPTGEPVDLRIVGSATIGGQEITRQAVPAEDMMQAFLWRHLVPARDLKALVFNPATQPMPGRLARTRPQPLATPSPAAPRPQALAPTPRRTPVKPAEPM